MLRKLNYGWIQTNQDPNYYVKKDPENQEIFKVVSLFHMEDDIIFESATINLADVPQKEIDKYRVSIEEKLEKDFSDAILVEMATTDGYANLETSESFCLATEVHEINRLLYGFFIDDTIEPSDFID